MNEASLKRNMLLNAGKVILTLVFYLISFSHISNVLGVENLGKYSFSYSIIEYFLLFANLGVVDYAVREGARIRDDREKFESFASEIFSLNLVTTLISYLALLICVILVSKFHLYWPLISILAIRIIFQTLGVEWVFTIYEDYVYLNIRAVLFQFISFILLMTLVENENDLLIYTSIMAFSTIGRDICNLFFLRKHCRLSLTLNINWRKHLKPILTIFAFTLTTSLYVNSDMTILGFLCSDYETGIYSVAVNVYTVLKGLLSSIIVVSVPRFAALLGKKDKEGYNELARDVEHTLMLLVMPTATGVLVLRKEIISLISSSDYYRAAAPLGILAIAVILAMGAWFWTAAILVPAKQEKVVFKAALASALVNIVLNFILIPYYQEVAAAFTTVIAEGLSFLICYLGGRNLVKIKGSRKSLLQILTGCIGISIFIKLLSLSSLSNSKLVVLAVIGSVIIYGLIEIFLKNDAMMSLVNLIKGRLNFQKKEEQL